ncbi:MAG: transcriptional repressor NrdR [Clostridia bacterium]|nr:transcriptional repressor NrdR [Clostridia bacterium]
MKCIYCQGIDNKVVDSRPSEDNTAIRRRRECLNCGRRFTTYEKVEELPIMVIKKDGRREPFDSMKISHGVRKACEKRPVSAQSINQLVTDIEHAVNNLLLPEVESTRIGEMVMERLKDMDEVAYVRFASVYRQFTDVNTFIIEIEKLLGTAAKPQV